MNNNNLSSVGQDILLSGRTQLCLALPYLSGPLCTLVPLPGEEITVSSATDGETLYYNASYLATGFLKSDINRFIATVFVNYILVITVALTRGIS